MKKISVFLKTAINIGILPIYLAPVAEFCEFYDIYIGWLQNLKTKHFNK